MNTSTAVGTIAELIIVGSGPAGYTAAIYAARAELSPIVFEGTQFGGELMKTTMVENFPGFHMGIEGPALMDTMRQQALRFGAKLHMEDVDEISLAGEIKKVKVGEKFYHSKAVILAMGATARYLGLEDEQRLLGRGVSTCATCDGFFFKDKKIAVVGGGDSAMEEAIFLTKFADIVYIIHRRDKFRASRIMFDRAHNNRSIEFITNTTVDKIAGEDSVTGLVLSDTHTKVKRNLQVDGVFLAIGHDPRSDLIVGQIDLDEAGYVLTQGRSSYTSVPGVFAAGDLVDRTYRQAITAAGSGCSAAIDAERWLIDRN